MTNKSTETSLTDRAFHFADQGDLEGLLACLDEGFDVNGVRLGHGYDPLSSGLVPIEIHETISSLSFRKANWHVLKTLIERYGTENLMLADELTPEPAKTLRDQTYALFGREWKDLHEKTFENSPAHFCLWRIANPAAKILSTPASRQNDMMWLSGTGSVPWLTKRESELKNFLNNCEALEQKNALSKSVSETKEKKAEQKKPSAL